MIKNGIEFLDSFLYDIRNEYTGYVHQTSILQFVNETALNYVEELLKSKEDVIHDLNSLRVITNGIGKPVIKSGVAGYLTLPIMKKHGTTEIQCVNIPPIPPVTYQYPNILRLNSVSVLPTSIWNNDDLKVTIITKDLMPTVKKKYYRKPDNSNERIYGYYLSEFDTYAIMYVTGDWIYYVLDYYMYPNRLEYTLNNTSYDSNLLNKIKTMCVVRFLERIKDERFQNFVSKQQ